MAAPSWEDLPVPDIVAAGAVVVRKGHVLMIHRPKYDDWTFPKGKQDPGEHDLHTAVREVQEETGLRVRLGLPLTSMAYHQGPAVKVVHYWVARVVGSADVGRFVPNAEVDQVEWVPFADAPGRLTYSRDVLLLEEALADAKKTVPLIVLRHATARRRKHWSGDDRTRPLTPTGQRQAEALVPMLAAYGVRRVATSSSTRCSDTVWPYALAAELDVDATPSLSEEHSTPARVAKVLAELLAAGKPTVICTHRPVLPTVLNQLGIEPGELHPGEMVVVHHRKGELKALEQHRPD